jgi:hypothetical protein
MKQNILEEAVNKTCLVHLKGKCLLSREHLHVVWKGVAVVWTSNNTAACILKTSMNCAFYFGNFWGLFSSGMLHGADW